MVINFLKSSVLVPRIKVTEGTVDEEMRPEIRVSLSLPSKVKGQ